MSATAVAPLALLLAVGGMDLWVYIDAKAHEQRGTPVVFSSSLITMDTPAAWALGCLILWVLVLPLYVRMRRQGD